MRRIQVFFISFCACACLLQAQDKSTGKVIDVAKYGAIPDDGKDDTKALRKAVAYARTQAGSTIYFPSGVYQLKDDDAVRLEKDVFAGKMGANPEKVIYTPYYPYSKGLDFNGSTDLTVSAKGATLLCEGWMEPISIDSCTRVKIQGLTIDYKRKPFSSGEIVAIEPTSFDVQFTDERQITNEMPLTRMTIWNKKKNRMYPEPIYFPKRELLGSNKVRFHHQIPVELLGAEAGVLHSFHFCPAILIHQSTQTELEDITIHSQAGMGIVGFDSKDILIKRLSVVPAPGYTISTNTDATHFACCEGLLRFEGCTFQGQGDDATNVHGYYQTIVSATANRAEILVKAGTYTHAQVADVPRVGDVMELVEISTLKPVRTYQVTAVSHQAPATASQVTLSDNLPSDFSNYYLMNITKLPRLEFENSLINSHLARGILVKTRSVLINNNVFRGGTGTAIHVGAESSWHEGTHSKDVVITNNVMAGCGSGAGGQGGASGIAVIIEAKDTRSSYLHDQVRIENNLIMGEGNPCGIYIGNADHVVLKENHVLNCQQDYIIHSTKNLQKFNYDYSQTWVTKICLAVPDRQGGSEVRLTFEQALEMIRQSDNLSLGVPKIVYLVGWQYNGHDDKYPAFFEVNEHLKRPGDTSALESLRWLMREARKYNTTISLHINMTDAYDDSPLWPEYIAKDLISKNSDGTLKVIGEYNGRKAYQINYRNEWESGYTQMRINRLLDLLPELKEAGTIHVDAWIARPSEGHNESQNLEAEYQKKAAMYWREKGVDITSEWVMDYMLGYVPYAWHFNGANQNDYLQIPANQYTGTGINPDIRSSDHDLGFLFGTSCYGEPFWKIADGYSWQSVLTKDFMLKCPQYFFLNSFKRLSVEGTGKGRTSYFSDQVSVSLADSTVRQKDRILRSKNTICIPAVWRKDNGVIVYSSDANGKTTFDIPYAWGTPKSATLYKITTEGLQKQNKIPVSEDSMEIDLMAETPYYVIPD